MSGFEYPYEINCLELPYELTSLFEPSECKLCHVRATSAACAYSHYEGRPHFRNIKKYLEENNIRVGSVKRNSGNNYCETCNVTLSTEIEAQIHYNGTTHINNLHSFANGWDTGSKTVATEISTKKGERGTSDGETPGVKGLNGEGQGVEEPVGEKIAVENTNCASQPGVERQDGGQLGVEKQDGGQPGVEKQDGEQPGVKKQDIGQPGFEKQDGEQPGVKKQDIGQPGVEKQDGGQPGVEKQDGGQSGVAKSDEEKKDEDTTDPSDWIYCKVCNLYSRTQQQMKEHQASSEHIGNIKYYAKLIEKENMKKKATKPISATHFPSFDNNSVNPSVYPPAVANDLMVMLAQALTNAVSGALGNCQTGFQPSPVPTVVPYQQVYQYQGVQYPSNTVLCYPTLDAPGGFGNEGGVIRRLKMSDVKDWLPFYQNEMGTYNCIPCESTAETPEKFVEHLNTETHRSVIIAFNKWWKSQPDGQNTYKII